MVYLPPNPGDFDVIPFKDSFRKNVMSSGDRRTSDPRESRDVFLQDGFTHDSSLDCFINPIAASLTSG
jgi:hypothetical protein